MTGRTVAFETLGCKLNQYETDALAAGFLERGWKVVDSRSQADVVVVNTCTVTNKADQKSLHAVNRFRLRPTAPLVVVTGCAAETSRAKLQSWEGVSLVVPNAQKNQIPALVEAHFRSDRGPLPAPDPFGYPVHEKIFHTRASLKIQDGCDNFCTFCIIPTVRGRAVSRPWEEVIEAAKALIASGRKELVLTGVNMGRWSEGGRRFVDLVAALLDLDGEFRLRITSLEPEGLGEDFARLLLHPKMAPHLHLCLQSGSPRILLAMRREYSLDDYRKLVTLVRSHRPDLNLTTDLIVGFPGETEEDLNLSLQAIHEFDLGFAHVFPFSRREGTRADRMPEQVPESVKTSRSQRVQKRVQDQRFRLMEARLGQERTVLVETSSKEGARDEVRGLSEDYFPVRISPAAPWNTFVQVRLTNVVRINDEWVFEAERC